MSKLITTLVAIGLFFFATNTTTAQTEQGTFRVHIGPTIPMDDFGDESLDNSRALGQVSVWG